MDIEKGEFRKEPIEEGRKAASEFDGELLELRERVHGRMEEEVSERLEKNPVPTEDEVRMGAFREFLEPQVRDAIPEFLRKGYATESSDFARYYFQPEPKEDMQGIDGYFMLDEETKAKLKAIGVEAHEEGNETFLLFKPDKADIESMKQKWDEAVAILPERTDARGFSLSLGAFEFREKYALHWRGKYAEDAIIHQFEAYQGKISPEEDRELREFLDEIGEIRDEHDPETADKYVEWAVRRKEIDHIEDAIGHEVDGDIKEAVLAFQVSGLRTSQSCEGHEDHGISTPWIEMEAIGEPTDALFDDIYRELAKKYEISAAEVRTGKNIEAFKEAARRKSEISEYREWRGENEKMGQMCQDLLDEFYKDREVDDDLRLVVTYDTDTSAPRAHSGGGSYREALPSVGEEERARRAEALPPLRSEMQAFADFLRDKFFK